MKTAIWITCLVLSILLAIFVFLDTSMTMGGRPFASDMGVFAGSLIFGIWAIIFKLK